MPTYNTVIDRLFRNSHHQVVLWQAPNLVLVLYAVCTILGWIIHRGSVHTLVTVGSFGFLFTWAWLEITQGVDYFRRLLGLAVLLYMVISRL